MKSATQTCSVSPRIGVLLSQVTETPDIETALIKVLMEYLDLKIERLRQRIQSYESKWQMPFEEFAERSEAGTLPQDPFSYEVESDFWEWEQAETLLKHYETLQTRWI
jgi:hypothetical protein